MMIPKIIFSDFDGTLTKGTELGPEFFDILELINGRQSELIIVTGRSVSWAHFLITHISSLRYVIAEGGGVLVSRNKSGNPVDKYLVSEADRKKLQSFSRSLLKKFFQLKLTTDSLGRETDRAIELSDFHADTERMNEIKAFMQKEKINFSTSSVHLNFWCGEISKYLAVKGLLTDKFKNIAQEECIYFGDSLNDQSMFRHFENSVGVSNIIKVLKNLEYRPHTVLEGEENIGPFGVLNYLTDILK